MHTDRTDARLLDDLRGPSAADLAEIDAEWPVIAAALAVTDAEARLAATPADAVARRAHRRAVRRLLTLNRALPISGSSVMPTAVPPAA